MLLVLDWAGAGYAPQQRHEFLRVAAELRRENALTGCLAALPADRLERGWLLTMLGALKRAGDIRTAVTIAGAAMSRDSLAACVVAELDEAIVVQRGAEARPLIELVHAHQRAFRHAAMTVRVWIDGQDDSFHRHVAEWLHAGVTLSGIERIPFTQVAADEQASATDGASRPLACQWVRSTLNLTGSGALHPCPVHRPPRDDAGSARPVRGLLAQRETWLQTLGSHPACRGCHRLVRFAGSERIFKPEPAFGPGPDAHAAGTFIDHVGGDANALPPAALDDTLAAFGRRLRSLTNERPS